MLGMQSPWKFWNVRDVRTVVDIMKINPKEFIFNGIKHNALDDAVHQVKYMTSKF
jgi:inhibitor of KinA sporulation pathway (predicted exonuclease)